MDCWGIDVNWIYLNIQLWIRFIHMFELFYSEEQNVLRFKWQ